MADTTKKGLGRGFDVLIPTDFDSSLLMKQDERVQKLFIKQIKPNEQQPRKHFDTDALDQLAESIKQYGIIQPLVVTPENDDSYRIIAGERRWRAAQKAGLERVPVIVRSSKELEQLEIALVENVQRVDLSPLEQAASIQRLHDQFSMGYGEISKRLGKAETTINNIVRLLQLPENARRALHEKKISEGHARSILALKDLPEKQEELLKLIEDRGWSVRQAEQFVQACKRNPKAKADAIKPTRIQTPETKRLSKQLSAPVSIRKGGRGGKIEISYKNDDELQRLLNTLGASSS